MKAERVDRNFLRKLIVSVSVAVTILLVSSGGPFGGSDEGVEAQTPPTVNFVNNLSVVGGIAQGSTGQRLIGNQPDRFSQPDDCCGCRSSRLSCFYHG